MCKREAGAPLFPGRSPVLLIALLASLLTFAFLMVFLLPFRPPWLLGHSLTLGHVFLA